MEPQVANAEHYFREPLHQRQQRLAGRGTAGLREHEKLTGFHRPSVGA
jgi:hypothetical protein